MKLINLGVFMLNDQNTNLSFFKAMFKERTKAQEKQTNVALVLVVKAIFHIEQTTLFFIL